MQAFIIWFIISISIFYYYALRIDRIKRDRHNGIPIGYEYPHPIKSITTEKGRTTGVQYAESKGIYDLGIKSEPNPHAIIIGELGAGKSNLMEVFLTRVYIKMNIPFIIIDWNGTYKKRLTYGVYQET